MKPFKLTPDDVAFTRLLEYRKYLREEKIPALERLFDVLKEEPAGSGGIAAPWHLTEYNEVRRQIEETQHAIQDIEAGIRDYGHTVEGLDDLENGIEYGDPT
jgi:hypothetical protein